MSDEPSDKYLRTETSRLRLRDHSNHGFSRGAPKFLEFAWMIISWLLLTSWVPGTAHRRYLLRLFGATIGSGVVVKPRVRVKFPWRLTVGEHSWIGEGVWIDNLAPVKIDNNVCLSQEAYLCTGSHDWSSETFDLIVEPIVIREGAWVAARTTVGPGVTIGEGAVLGLGSVATQDLLPWTVYSGSPAKPVKKRKIRFVGDATDNVRA